MAISDKQFDEGPLADAQVVQFIRSAAIKQSPPLLCLGDDIQVGDIFLNDNGKMVAFFETLGDEDDGRLAVCAIGEESGTTTYVREPIPVLYRLPREIDTWVLEAIASIDDPPDCILFQMSCWKCKSPGLAFGVSAMMGSHYDVDAGLFRYPVILSGIRNELKKLPSFRLGTVKKRYSKTAGESYLSQGCPKCDALWGDFPLGQEFWRVILDYYQCGQTSKIAAMWSLDLRALISA